MSESYSGRAEYCNTCHACYFGHELDGQRPNECFGCERTRLITELDRLNAQWSRAVEILREQIARCGCPEGSECPTCWPLREAIGEPL